MVATAAAYQRATAGAVSVRWIPRSLHDFGIASVKSLARDYDLIVVDHPHAGAMADSGCVLPLDEFADPAVLAALAKHSPGGSQQSYHYGGHQWALAIDAACHASAWRQDLLPEPPAGWDEVLALSDTGQVLWPLCGTDAYASLLTLAAASGRPCGSATSSFVDRDVGRWALGLMHSVARRSDRRCLAMNPIAALDAMSGTDDFAYCPLTFCYVNYSRADAVGKTITFGDIPAVTSGAPAVSQAGDGSAAAGGPVSGALLGGAGLAVSALRPQARRAIDYTLYVADAQTQRGLYFTSGGQPAHQAAWADPQIDAASGGFFSGLAGTIRRAWTRPRGPAFAGVQSRMTEQFARWWECAAKPDAFLDDLNHIYQQSMTS